MMLANVEEIEKVFNETFVPASDHDFLPISSSGDAFHQDDKLDGRNFNVANESPLNCREIFFAHRSIVPDPDEVICLTCINSRIYFMSLQLTGFE